MLRVLLFIAFLLVPVLEIWTIIKVGQAIGGWPTAGVLVVVGLIGVWLVRHEGRRAWRGLREALNSGRMPDRELADSAMVMAGGALLAAPGFLSDVAGLALILPFTRPLARRGLSALLGRRMRQMAGDQSFGVMFPGQGRPGGAAPGPSRVVSGQVIVEETPGGRAPGASRAELDGGDD